ncbi:hypothetical protein GC167_02270 [bacterium]|nr:hypothetical protein [bacterium]
MQLRSKFKTYGAIGLEAGLSGAEIAERMLHSHGIRDVKIQSVPGKLTDHYNPLDKTVNLSPEVYEGRSISAAAVAAHECGHAVQHATAYQWLQLRSALVPAVNFANRGLGILFMVMLFGSFAVKMFPMETVLWTIIILQGAITLFTVVTLPVEYDASRRALVWLKQTRTATVAEQDKAQDALKWAANTYLVAALASVTQLAHYVMMLLGNRD